MSFQLLARASVVGVCLLTGCQQGSDGSMALKKAAIAAPGAAGDCAGSADPSCNQGAAPAAERVEVSLPAHAPRRGTGAAPVVLTVFSDFECGFCARASGTVEALHERYGKDLQIVFRQLPLPFHKNAQLAAEASLAANEQGRFWAFHDQLFANPGALTRADLEKHAEAAGLDLPRFRAALDDGRHRAAVEADKAEAARLGVQGTPSFIINGTRIVGAQPVEKFAAVIDAELAQARR